MARIITISSGKGGVGKTNLSVNLAVRLSALGYKTCLFDADLGLANVNILLGLVPEFTLGDLIEGTCSFDDLLIKNIHGIDIVPGSTGVAMLADLGPDLLDLLIEKLAGMEEYDYILFDTSAGISRQVVSFCMAASQVLVTVVPEPTSLTDAYSLLKVLFKNGYDKTAFVVVNRSRDQAFGERIFEKFNTTVKKFLPLEISHLGTLQEDPHVSEAVAMQTPYSIAFPQCPASRGVADIADKIDRQDKGLSDVKTMAAFIRRTMDILAEPMEHLPQKKPPVPIEGEAPVKATSSVPDQSKDERADDIDRVEKDEMISQVLMALNSLVKNTERISEELTALRRDMENRKPVARASETAPREKAKAPVIDLDFEKFVRESQHKKA